MVRHQPFDRLEGIQGTQSKICRGGGKNSNINLLDLSREEDSLQAVADSGLQCDESCRTISHPVQPQSSGKSEQFKSRMDQRGLEIKRLSNRKAHDFLVFGGTLCHCFVRPRPEQRSNKRSFQGVPQENHHSRLTTGGRH